MKSFAVRCIFEAPVESINTKKFLYEERITLWRALDIDQAIDRAQDEAKQYCRNNPGFRFSGLSQAFWMFQPVEGDGVEVFSLLRESDLQMDEYLDRFFSTGDERQRSSEA